MTNQTERQRIHHVIISIMDAEIPNLKITIGRDFEKYFHYNLVINLTILDFATHIMITEDELYSDDFLTMFIESLSSIELLYG